ncbi:MAG: hypothetical protein EOP38_11470 [Rubrivivax sp.]|nr:MAG: hypothetical protein EOP38_11470 [Rubrivivax sp.]
MFGNVRLMSLMTRLGVRYIPAVLALLLSKLIYQHQGEQAYASYALILSFAALMPLLDLGFGAWQVQKGADASVAKTAILAVPLQLLLALGAIWLLYDGEARRGLLVFVSSFAILFPLYMAGRFRYATEPVDRLLQESLGYQLVFYVLCFAAVGFTTITRTEYSAEIIVACAICGALAPLATQGFSIRAFSEIRKAPLVRVAGRYNLMSSALIAIVGAWSNQALLTEYGSSAEVVSYDLIWRIVAITMVSQIYLQHRLPDFCRHAKNVAALSDLLRSTARLAVLLSLLQVGAVILLAPLYYRFVTEATPHWPTIVYALAQAIVFALIIPYNLFLIAKDRIWSLNMMFGLGALVSLGGKLVFKEQEGTLTASAAFGFTAAGYAFSLLIMWITSKRLLR